MSSVHMDEFYAPQLDEAALMELDRLEQGHTHPSPVSLSPPQPVPHTPPAREVEEASEKMQEDDFSVFDVNEERDAEALDAALIACEAEHARVRGKRSGPKPDAGPSTSGSDLDISELDDEELRAVDMLEGSHVHEELEEEEEEEAEVAQSFADGEFFEIDDHVIQQADEKHAARWKHEVIEELKKLSRARYQRNKHEELEKMLKKIRKEHFIEDSGIFGSLLHTATSHGAPLSVVRLLVEAPFNADVNWQEEDQGADTTPLTLAAAKGTVAVTEYLLAHSADLEARTERGNTCLISACKNPRPLEMVRLLLTKSAALHKNDCDDDCDDCDDDEEQENGAAAFINSISTPSNKKGEQECALSLAIRSENLALVELLLANGADANLIMNRMYNRALKPLTPLFVAMPYISRGGARDGSQKKIVSALLAAGADPTHSFYDQTFGDMKLCRAVAAIHSRNSGPYGIVGARSADMLAVLCEYVADEGNDATLEDIGFVHRHQGRGGRLVAFPPRFVRWDRVGMFVLMCLGLPHSLEGLDPEGRAFRELIHQQDRYLRVHTHASVWHHDAVTELRRVFGGADIVVDKVLAFCGLQRRSHMMNADVEMKKEQSDEEQSDEEKAPGVYMPYDPYDSVKKCYPYVSVMTPFCPRSYEDWFECYEQYSNSVEGKRDKLARDKREIREITLGLLDDRSSSELSNHHGSASIEESSLSDNSPSEDMSGDFDDEDDSEAGEHRVVDDGMTVVYTRDMDGSAMDTDDDDLVKRTATDKRVLGRKMRRSKKKRVLKSVDGALGRTPMHRSKRQKLKQTRTHSSASASTSDSDVVEVAEERKSAKGWQNGKRKRRSKVVKALPDSSDDRKSSKGRQNGKRRRKIKGKVAVKALPDSSDDKQARIDELEREIKQLKAEKAPSNRSSSSDSHTQKKKKKKKKKRGRKCAPTSDDSDGSSEEEEENDEPPRRKRAARRRRRVILDDDEDDDEDEDASSGAQEGKMSVDESPARRILDSLYDQEDKEDSSDLIARQKTRETKKRSDRVARKMKRSRRRGQTDNGQKFLHQGDANNLNAM